VSKRPRQPPPRRAGVGPGAGSGTGAIKRYDNRKLYDTGARRYVTVGDLAERVGRGEDLHVEDQKTGADITTVVLAQALFEAVKQQTAEVPRQVLARIIRLGSRRTSPAASPPPDPGARAREEAERIVSGLLAKGRLSLEEALSLRQEIAGALHRITVDLQRGVEARLHGLLSHADGPNTQASLDKLRERLLAFETYLTASPRRPGGRR
jgi:polyhydroxyalkanoate synthesis repressor PhaR